MTDYISREAAIAYIREQSEECQKAFEELGGESGIYADAYNDLADNFYSIPAADVAPVVRGSGSGKPMVESVQPLTAQAAPKPMTNGDRIRAMTDEERVQRDRQRYLDIGLDSGAQIVHDMLCVALRDKQAMGDDVWGKERIVRLLTRLNELKEEFGPAFRPGPEQDYMQEQLDGALREIFGAATVPFTVRHPYIREIDYTKRR